MSARRATPLLIVLTSSLGLGCYTTGRVSFADHPELAGVRLAARAHPEDYEDLFETSSEACQAAARGA